MAREGEEEEGVLVYSAQCWRYEIAESATRAHAWCRTGRGVTCELRVCRPAAADEPCRCTLRETQAPGRRVTVPLVRGVVFAVCDSVRYFVLVLGAGVRAGIGLYSRADSEAFARVVCESTHEPAIPLVPGADADAEADTDAVAASPSGSHAAGDTDESEIHGEVPHVEVERTHVRTTRALSRAAPGRPSFSSPADGSTATVSENKKETKEGEDEKDEGEEDKKDEEKGNDDVEQEDKEQEEQEEQEEEEEMVGAARRKKHEEEDFSQARWRRHRKHFFVVSASGKPVYSRYGDEQRLAPFMASLMALVSFVEDAGDALRYFVAGALQVVFLRRGPMLFVVLASTSEHRTDLARELHYMSSQLVSILTATTLTTIFASRADYDLRDLLTATDNLLLDNMCHLLGHDAGYMMGAIEPVPLAPAVRGAVAAALARAACPELLYAFLFCGTRLVQCVRPRRFTLDPVDFHVLVNFIRTSTSERSSRTWTPICLPAFDERGFLHAFVYHVAADTILVLLSTKVDAYYRMAACAQRIEADLAAARVLDALAAAAAHPPLAALAALDQNLQHFVYRSTALRQIVVPALEGPYAAPREQKRLLRVYQKARQETRALAADAPGDAPLPSKVYYKSSRYETVVSFVTQTGELHVAVCPSASKSLALKAAALVLRWVADREKELFIPSFPFWS